MKDEEKTKEQIITELVALRQRLAELELLTSHKQQTREPQDTLKSHSLEAVFAQSEETFHCLVQHSSDIITVLGATGIALYESPSIKTILGYEVEELLGKSVFEYVHPEDAPSVQATFRQVIEQPGVVSVEYRFRHAQGYWIHIESCGNNLLEHPKIKGVVINSRDISERRLAEQHRLAAARTQQLEVQMAELRKLDQLKDDFLSTVSHELRSPMANIKMAIQMLKIAPTAEKRESYLRILENECCREAELINNLLDLQQLQVEDSSSLTETIALQNWVPRVLEAFYLRAEQRQQRFTLDLSPSVPSVTLHPSSLERILVELVNNACKYTPAGGEIVVKVRPGSSTSVKLSVTNWGAEIPPDQLTRIFDKFYRIPQSNPWQQNGTGLGLALVKKLVERLRGTINVQSQLGQTTFLVDLPQK